MVFHYQQSKVVTSAKGHLLLPGEMASPRENPREDLGHRHGLVRRVARLPLGIIEGVTRAMGHRVTSPHHAPQQPRPSMASPEDLRFLHAFEQQFGDAHPFFYACPFADALRLAGDESRLLFVYLHDPGHPYTAPFCRATLCSELATQFLDANFASWGANAAVGEGSRVASALRAPGFPFCAVVAPVHGGGFTLLQQMEGPVSPAELVEILQRTVEEQGSAFMSSRREEAAAAARRARSQLREEQDAAYLASLQLDQEKERFRDLLIEDADPLPPPSHRKQEKKNPATGKPGGGAREGFWGTQKQTGAGRNPHQNCQIMVRFPNGERREQSFLSTDRIRSIYRFIDSLDVPGLGSYRLVSIFPTRVFGYEQLDMTLKDAGLHQRATLFLELLH